MGKNNSGPDELTFKLTTWERINITQIVGRLQGDAAMMYKAITLFDILEFSEEEKLEINLQQLDQFRMSWDKPDHRWPISFPDVETREFVKMAVMKNDKWLAGQAREIGNLHEALGLPWPPVK